MHRDPVLRRRVIRDASLLRFQCHPTPTPVKKTERLAGCLFLGGGRWTEPELDTEIAVRRRRDRRRRKCYPSAEGITEKNPDKLDRLPSHSTKDFRFWCSLQVFHSNTNTQYYFFGPLRLTDPPDKQTVNQVLPGSTARTAPSPL